jgi:hypothetical protein
MLDDLILVPLGIWLELRLIPAHLMMEFRQQATELLSKPTSRVAAAIIIVIWLSAAMGIGHALHANLGAVPRYAAHINHPHYSG